MVIFMPKLHFCAAIPVLGKLVAVTNYSYKTNHSTQATHTSIFGTGLAKCSLVPLSQENPNYSFLLPFAQYNLQCPGYYLPVLQGKWVYPHSNSTCRIWNKIISYSAITRGPHRGGWVVGRAGGRQVAFFWRSGKRRCIFFHRSCW